MINKTIDKLFCRDKKHILTINIHKILLRFYCDRKRILTNIRQYLQYFTIHQETGIEDTTYCSISILNESDYEILRGFYVIQKYFEAFPGVEASFGTIENYSVYEIKASCLIIVNNRNNDCACILQQSNNRRIIHPDFIVHILMIEWLRGRGLFFIHSSGICRNDKAFLFVGPSGAGKTTTALMGIQSGLSFMGDDLLIVKENGKRITVHSYIEDVKFCMDMTSKFHELKKVNPATLSEHRETKTIKFDVKKYFDAKIADNAAVSKIFFLNKGNFLKKIKSNEALPLIMNNSFFYSSEETSVKHFEILCQLINSVDSYLVGRDYINHHFKKLIR